jgi:hypothetical protein
MSETLGDQEFVRIVTEVIRAEEEGIYTELELFAEILRHVRYDNVQSVIDLLPEEQRQRFISWAREGYDNDIDISEMFSIGGEGCRETPDEAIFAIRRWLAQHRNPDLTHG